MAEPSRCEAEPRLNGAFGARSGAMGKGSASRGGKASSPGVESEMTIFDTAWIEFGSVLFACGAVPAFTALVAEWRGQPAQPHAGAQLFHEEVRRVTPAQLEQIRHALAALDRAPARSEIAALK